MILGVHLYSFAFLSVLFFDQLSKWYILSLKQFPYIVNNFMAIDFAVNRGVMSGIFHSESFAPFVVVTSGIVLFLIVFSFFTWNRFKQGCSIFGETLVIAGALSNIFDRVLHGGVIDFIRLNYHHFVWPIFNIADVSIVIGVGLMLWASHEKQVVSC